MSRRTWLPSHAAFTRLARFVLGLGALAACAALVLRFVPLSSAFLAPTAVPLELGSWTLGALTTTFTCYMFTSLAAVIIGALLGGLTARRGARVLRPTWYNGAIRRGLELTGALPSVIFAAIWLNSHPGQGLAALIVVTLVQQVFEVGARVKSMIESPSSTWNDLWCEFSKSAAHVAVTLASGEIALIALGLASPSYATWPSSAASYLYKGGTVVSPTVLLTSLIGTIVLPVCLFLAGPNRPTSR